MADSSDFKTSAHLPYSFDFAGSENPYTLGSNGSSYTASASTTTSSTGNASTDKSSTTDNIPTYVNPSFDYFLMGLNFVGVGTKSVGRLSGSPAPSVPIPHPKWINGYTAIDHFSDLQRNSFAGWQLGVSFIDLIANDMIIDNMVIPDYPYTNQDLDPDNTLFRIQYDPTTGTMPLPDQFTFGTLVFVSGMLDEGLDPTRDLYDVQVMIDNNPKNTAARVGNFSYFSLLPIVNTPGFNTSLFALQTINLDKDSWQTQWFESKSKLKGVDPAMAAELISSYQDSGDAGAHDAMFTYFRLEYGIDLSNTDDPTTALVIGAAKDAAYVSPSSALASLFMASKALALGQMFTLNTTAAAGAQFTMREMMNMDPLAEDLTCVGIALGTGALQLGSAGLFSGYELEPVTYAAVGAEQAVGFYAARMADGDEELLLATTDGASQIGGAIAIPYALAALSYGTDYEYIINEDGSFSPNPSTSGFYWAVLGITNFSDIWSSRRAGKYLWKAAETDDLRYAAPAIAQGAGVLLSEVLYGVYSTKNPLPKTYVDDYEQLQEKYGFEDPFTSNNVNGAMTIPAVTTLAVNAVGAAWGYLEEKGQGGNKPTFVSQAELEAAGKEYQALIDAGADPVAIEAAQTRLFRMQVMVKTQEALAQGTLTPEQIELTSAENNYETLVNSGAPAENIEIAADRVIAAKASVDAIKTNEGPIVVTNSGTMVSSQIGYTKTGAGDLPTKTPLQLYRDAQAQTTLAVDHYKAVVAANASEAEIILAQKQMDAALASEALASKAMGKPDLLTWADKHVSTTAGPERAQAGLGVKVSF